MISFYINSEKAVRRYHSSTFWYVRVITAETIELLISLDDLFVNSPVLVLYDSVTRTTESVPEKKSRSTLDVSDSDQAESVYW